MQFRVGAIPRLPQKQCKIHYTMHTFLLSLRYAQQREGQSAKQRAFTLCIGFCIILLFQCEFAWYDPRLLLLNIENNKYNFFKYVLLMKENLKKKITSAAEI